MFFRSYGPNEMSGKGWVRRNGDPEGALPTSDASSGSCPQNPTIGDGLLRLQLCVQLS
jgi:hypothetical protein